MLSQEKGTISGSECFYLQPAADVENLLYYLTGCGVFFCEYGYRIDRENYGNYMLLYVDKGNLVVMSEGKTYLVQQGQAAFLNCHLPHTYYAKGYVSFLYIHFDGANTKEFYETFIEKKSGILLSGESAESVMVNMNTVISQYRNNLDVEEVQNSKIIYNCLCKMVFEVENDNQPEITSKRVTGLVKDYIRQNFNQTLSINALAELVGLSE